MSIEWRKAHTHDGWYVKHEGVAIIVHSRGLAFVNLAEWFLTCGQVGFQSFRLTSENVEDAKQEALAMVEGKIAALSCIIDEISDALEGE
jgi:hypothetical protein